MKTSKGFTLIELMIVIAIIGILAAVAAGAMKNRDTAPAYQLNSYQLNSSRVVPDKPATNNKCESGIVTRGGVAVKDGSGNPISC